MTTQGREWQPGDKAFVEVEVVEFGDQPEVLVHLPRGDGPGVQAIVRTSDLRPVPAGGEVEAATEDVIERLAQALFAEAHSSSTYRFRPSLWPDAPDFVRAQYRTMAQVAAGLLVGGVPGRSEAETEWGVMSDRHGYVVYTDFTSREQAQGHLMDDSYVVSRQVGPWTAARVAGTTEAGDDRG